MSRIGIVSALPRELAPVVRGWSRTSSGAVQVWSGDAAIASCAGMGSECVTHAADELATAGVTALVSIGICGGLSDEASAASVWVPATVVDARTGERFDTGIGHGTLVSVSMVVDGASKRALAEQYGGDIVDMEAAAVARHAERKGLSFYAVKAVSDTRDARMPDLNRFNRSGQFQTARFAAHMMVRPWLWPLVAQLGRDSANAIRALNAELQQWITAGGPPEKYRHSAVQH